MSFVFMMQTDCVLCGVWFEIEETVDDVKVTIDHDRSKSVEQRRTEHVVAKI
jgi:hypothetical protein